MRPWDGCRARIETFGPWAAVPDGRSERPDVIDVGLEHGVVEDGDVSILLWVRQADADPEEDGSEPGDAMADLTVEEAKRVRDALDAAIAEANG